jgi:arabinogalactan endo-1,4-beta-galactosidase
MKLNPYNVKTTRCIIVGFIFFCFSCERKNPIIEEYFAKGADISWVTQMEDEGRKFYNRNGVETDCFELMKSLGINSIRLRVWVNPVEHGNYCNTGDLVKKAKRADALDMKLMVDFHYSDWWADPAHQNKPAAWENYDLEQLKNAVAEHTKEVLKELKSNKIHPEWIQIGNETTNGMLWDTGKVALGEEHMKNYAELHIAGYEAAKSIFPDAKIIIHIDNGFDNIRFRRILDGIKKYGAKWDVVGMSLYPSATNWQEKNNQLIANTKDMITRYDSEVMICEVGMPYTEAEACKNFLSDLLRQAKAVPGNKCLGVFYWEPEAYDWQEYLLGAFDTSGKPTIAMDAFTL